MKSLAGGLTETPRKLNARILTSLAAALGLAMCCAGALAQSGAGMIEGTVQDTTHAAIPGATIRVINQATGVVSTTKSNQVGFYQVPDLFWGHYTVSVAVPSMKTYETAIQLLVAQTAVINPVMTPGSVTQTVIVSGNAVQLTTVDSGVVSGIVEAAQFNQLPENGRELDTLLGNVVPGMNAGTQVNSLPVESLEYTIDGAPTEQNLYGGYADAAEQLVDPDTIQEVNVQLMDSGAQYARPATAVVTSKSGTNRLHGTFFETAENNALGIAKDRQDPAVYSAPHYVRNEFGASAGGPIILPHIYHGKNRSFWFFAYERYSLAENAPDETTVPTPAMRQGDFSGLIDSSGILQTLYDPSTTTNSTKCAYGTAAKNAYCRTPFPNNQIPTSEMSPVAKLYYQLVPQPTNTNNPLVNNNINLANPDLNLRPQWTVRLDHTFNDKNKAYLRYTQNSDATDTTSALLNQPVEGFPVGAAQGYLNAPRWSHVASIGYTHIFSPTFFSETVASQQWLKEWEYEGADTLVDYESKLGLPNNFGEVGFPAIGDGDLIDNLKGSQDSYGMSQIISQLDENITKVLGRHQLHFGGRFRHERVMDLPEGTNDTEAFGTAPTAIYNTSTGAKYTALTYTGYADASFFLGSANSYDVNLEPPHYHTHRMEFDAYLQDDYHVTKNLTFNFGLRYEAHPAIWSKYGVANSFDLKNDAMILGAPPATLIAEGYTTQALITNDEDIGINFETPAEAGVSGAMYRNYDLNFLPRAGFAYQLFGGRFGTVIRGGYGRYSAMVPYADMEDQLIKNNPLTAQYTMSYTTAAQARDDLPNELIRYNAPVQFGVMGVNTANVVNTAVTNSVLPGVTIYGVSPDYPPESDTVVNFTVEQRLKGNSALRTTWTWTHGTNFPNGWHFNNHPSDFQWELATGTVPPTGNVIGSNQYSTTALGPYNQTTWGSAMVQKESTGWMNDNALEVNYQRLFHHGSAYQVTFKYHRDLSTGTQQDMYNDADYPGVMGTVGVLSSPYGTIGFPGVPPPARPANLPVWQNWHAMDDYLLYQLNTGGGPTAEIRFNFIVDLPVGRGKRFLGNVNRFVNELVGGFQLAGTGGGATQTFGVPTGDFGPVSKPVVYRHRYPITDCRTGNCYKAIMWFNGYLAPTVTQGVAGSVCTTDCVTGLPADYVPLQSPIDTTVGSTYYNTNDVVLTLANGTQDTIAYDAGPLGADYDAKSYLSGPINYNADLSLFKVFPITERVNLRVDMDAFNAFNYQGYDTPGTGGVLEVQPGVGVADSFESPRQIQLTARLTF